jgi:hypothetical protein
MKITVKISDIEICIERPEFKEWASNTAQKDFMTDTIIPTLEKAIEKAKELYNNRIENL